MEYKYNPLESNFIVYEPVIDESYPRKYTMNILDDEIDLPSGISTITNDGTIIFESNLEDQDKSGVVIDNNPIEYNNFSHIDQQSDTQIEQDDESYENIEAPKTALERGVVIAKELVRKGNFSKEQAAAIAGVMIDENKANPHSYMHAEKQGKGASGTGGFGYGAGIGSWTGTNYKNKLLTSGGYKPYTPIENLSLQQQIDLFIIDSNNNMKKYYDALRRCQTLEDASATAVIITGGIGHSKNWSTHPTQQEAKKMSDFYGRANDRRFGKSKYHWDLDKRRLAYARQVLERM